MITCSPPRLESDRWQRELAGAISDPAELLRILAIEGRDLPYAPLTAPGFALKVPRYFVGLMRHGDPHDPLLAQVLPLSIENLPGRRVSSATRLAISPPTTATGCCRSTTAGR